MSEQYDLHFTPFLRTKYNSINHTLCQKMKGFKKLLITHTRATPLRTNEKGRWSWCTRNNEKCIWQINILKATSIIPYIYDLNNGCHNNLAIIHNRRTIKRNFISKNNVSKQIKQGKKRRKGDIDKIQLQRKLINTDGKTDI